MGVESQRSHQMILKIGVWRRGVKVESGVCRRGDNGIGDGFGGGENNGRKKGLEREIRGSQWYL